MATEKSYARKNEKIRAAALELPRTTASGGTAPLAINEEGKKKRRGGGGKRESCHPKNRRSSVVIGEPKWREGKAARRGDR